MASKYTSTKISCYVGYIVQAIVNNFLPILFVALQDEYSLSYEQLARLIFFNFGTQIFIDLITPKIVDIVGYRTAAILSQGAAAAGLALLGVLPKLLPFPYIAIIISIIIYASGSGFMEVIISPMIEMLPTKDKSGNMAFLHSFYCWGQAFTVIGSTLMIRFFGFGNWSSVPLVWAIIPFVNMFAFFKVPVIEPSKEEKGQGFSTLIKRPKFAGYMLMMLCAGASEIAMADWASVFVSEALGVPKAVGDLAGPCAFAIFMGSGRVWYAKVSHKVSFKKTMIIMSLLCLVCYLVVAFCNIPIFSLLFCAFCGWTVSISWPGIYSAGAKEFPDGSAAMFSIFAFCGDMGCCLGPWSLGIIADAYGLNLGFAAMSVFPITMIITLLMTLKNKDCKKSV